MQPMLPNLSQRCASHPAIKAAGCLALLIFSFCLYGAAHAEGSLAEWRSEASQARALAENDAPRAYVQAQRLQVSLPADGTPVDRARVLNLLARIETYLALTEQSVKHTQLALELAKQHDDKVGQAEAEINVALNAVNQGKIGTLVDATTQILPLLDGVNRPDLLGEALLRTAVMYRRVGQFDESVTMAMQAMEIAKRTKDPIALTYAHQGLGISYDQSGHFAEARDHYLQMRNQARVAHSKLLEAYALTSLGRVTFSLGDPSGAEAYIRQAIPLYRAVGTPFGLSYGLFGLADHLRTQGRYAEAMPLLDEVVETYKKYPNRIGLWYTLNARSASYQSLGKTRAALADAERAYAVANDIGFPLYQSESAQRLATFAAASGNHRRAYELSVEAADMTAKAAREKASARIVELAQRYESESKQREIKELTHRNEQQTAELRQRMLQQRWLWTVLGGSVITLAGAAYLLRRLRRSHRMLEAANTELQRSQNNLQHQTGILQSVLDSMGDGVSVANERGELLLVNPAGEKIIGIGFTAGDSHAWAQQYGLYLPDQTTPYPAAELPLERAIRGESCDNVEIFVLNPMLAEGRWLSVTARPLIDKTGVARGGVAVFSDVTALKRHEEMLWESEHKYRTLAEHSPDLIIRYDKECRRVYVSDAYLLLHNKPPSAVLGKRPTEAWGRPTMPPADFEQKLRRVMETGARAEIELDWTTAEGEYHCHWLRAVPEYDREGKVVSVLSIARDVSEIRRAEKALYLHEQELRSLVENTPDTIARYDKDCRRIYANPRMVADLGAPLEQVLNKTPSQFPGGDSALAYEEHIRTVFASGQSVDFELSWKAGDGTPVVSHIRLAPEFGVGGEVISALAVGRDITEIDEYRQSIHHLAFYDSLTDLPNRALLSDRIHQTIADAAWHGYQFGLLLLDLDRFKEVNDTLGHSVGDLLLREAANRLLLCVRNYDTVARLGGDEFAVLLPQVREGDDLATIARKIIEAFEQPFNIVGKELFISASVGIALYPGDSAEIDALFKYADSAMYHAKKKGRNNFQFYAKELTARSTERMVLEEALRKALKNHELELHYQPQVELATGHIIGAEALLRWNRKEGGMVTPDKFIPVAEETGMIVSFGEWALFAACQAAVEWNRGRIVPFRIAVNFSTRQFIQNDLLASVRRILQETQCKPEWLKIEITESLLLEDSHEILAVLNAFDDMGLEIAIDDFGTGYSALSYLNRFPVSQIKIDRSFVRDIPNNQERAELVKAMISIAQALHMELIAEGVETREQADYLNLHGCLMGQGYLFGKPMPYTEFGKQLAEYQAQPTVDGVD